MNDYPCLYCGGHPDLGVSEPTVIVGREEFVIAIKDGQARVPLRAIGSIEEQPIVEGNPSRSTVTIVVTRRLSVLPLHVLPSTVPVQPAWRSGAGHAPAWQP